MRLSSLGVRPRRGAWGKGSRQATAAAAACLVAVILALSAAPPAAAFPCGDTSATATQGRHLTSVSADECRAPGGVHRHKRSARAQKKGSISALTVFVLAVAAALLIPIGRNGLPGGDPFGRDTELQSTKSRTR
jgi:hypothetical protein